MARHGFIPDEDLTGQKFYDGRLVRRLLGFLKPFWLMLLMAFLLLSGASLIDLYLPFLSKTAIDGFVVVNHQMFFFPGGDDADFYLDKYGGAMFPAGKDSFLIDGGILKSEDMASAVKLKLIAPKKYLPVYMEDYEGDEVSEVLGTVRAHDSLFFALAPAVGDTFASKRNFNFLFSRNKSIRRPDYAIEYNKLKYIPQGQLRVLRNRQLSGIFDIAKMYFILLALSFLVNFGQTIILRIVAQKSMHDIRVRLFDHLQRLSLKYFDSNPVGKLVTRATNDVNTISEMFTSVAVNLFKDLFMVVGVGAIMLYMNVKLTLIVFAIIPMIMISTIVFRKYLRDAYRWVRRSLASVNARLSEDLSGIRVIQAFVQEKRSMAKFDKVNDEYYRATMRMLWVNAIFRPIMTLFMNLAVAIILWYGGGQVIRQAMSLGMIMAYLWYIEMFFRPIMALSEKYNIMQAAMAAAERIFGIMDKEPDIQNSPEPYSPEPSRIEGRVEFREVWFAYNPDNWVLKGISFAVEPGDTIALVGATGAGKTTIISLISRLYDIQKGEILVDGVNIKNWDLDILRKSIGVVLQDVFLFSTNIRENIRLHDFAKEQEDVAFASNIVNAHEFISRLPKQYDEPVAERGATLSSGQRQLLSFARAMAFQPAVLILDEATSNIDTHTELLIQDAQEKLLTGRTSIVVAHRLSTIRNASEILVMHHGEIVERGKHEDLIDIGGYYSKLYELQFRNSNRENDDNNNMREV